MTIEKRVVDSVQRLQDYYSRHRLIPSYSGIAKLMGYRSKGAAYKLVGRMVDAGILERGPNQRLAPTPAFFGRPVIGSVRAGTPDSILDISYELVTIDSYLIERPSQTILFLVKGNSMVDAGIFDGDLAIIDRGRPAREGDIVVALFNGEATLKELGFQGKNIVLRPRNSDFEVIQPRVEVEILGVYIGLVRKIRDATRAVQRQQDRK